MGRCEKWAIIWSHFGDTQYGVKNEENMWTKSNKTRHSFLGQQNMKKNAGTTQYGADFLIVFCSLWLRLRKNMDNRQNIAGG